VYKDCTVATCLPAMEGHYERLLSHPTPGLGPFGIPSRPELSVSIFITASPLWVVSCIREGYSLLYCFHFSNRNLTKDVVKSLESVGKSC
jgi:hypothetical protein